jgi:predicted dithiol-disulfide oxidoreductase (DUF899 family)
MPTPLPQPHPVVSRHQWLEARFKLLAREKDLSRQKDQLNQERLQLPWVRVEKDYRFEGPDGEKSLADLFNGNSQLIIYHFMFGPDWDEGCPGCSLLVDHLDGPLAHLPHHDVSLAVISRAPWPKLAAYKKRMGWKFPWLSSGRSDFNFDFHVSFSPEDVAKGRVLYNYEWQNEKIDELSGHSAFYRDPASGDIFHTYSSYARSGEAMLGVYAYLDIAPKGRNENGPNHNLMDWVKRHDQYETSSASTSCCH